MRTLSIAWSSSRHLPTSWSSSASTSSSGRSSSPRTVRTAGVRHLGRAQPLEIADRQQRVLVDRVLVVEVAHHPPGDRLELGEHAPEQPAVVHLRQPRVEPGSRLQQSSSNARPIARRRERSRRRDSGRRAAGCTTALRRTTVRVGIDRGLKRPEPGRPGCAPPASDRGTGCRRARCRGSARPGPARSCAPSRASGRRCARGGSSRSSAARPAVAARRRDSRAAPPFAPAARG